LKKISAIAAFLSAAFLFLPFVCAQQDQAQVCVMKSVAGKVLELDWVTSTLVVKWLGASGYDEMTLTVPEDAQITKGTEKVNFGDVELSDDVYIRYRDCGFAGLKVISVNVNTNG